MIGKKDVLKLVDFKAKMEAFRYNPNYKKEDTINEVQKEVEKIKREKKKKPKERGKA